MTDTILPRFWQKLYAPKARDLRRPLHGVIALSLILLATTWSVTWQWLGNEQVLMLKNSQARQESLAIIISENFNRAMDQARIFSMASSEWFDGNPQDAAKRLSAMCSANQLFLRIALYDDTARQVYASSPDTDTSALTQAIHDRLANPADMSGLQLVPPVDSMTRAWQVQMLLPVLGKDNKSRGILLVVLDLGYVLGLYRDVDIGRTGAIQVLLNDGKEVARARMGGLEYTQGTWQTALFQPLHSEQGSVVANYFGDEHEYLTSYKHLAKYPFMVVVSRDVAELQVEYGASRARGLGVLCLFTVIILLATFWIGRSLRAREKLFDALRKADLENRKLILELEDQKHQAYELASHDALTGLPNRRLFLEMSHTHLTRAKRSRKHFGMLYVDLDRFKSINDTLGHHVGDLLLQTVASRLQSALRESDVIARMGGDEFTVMLNELDSVADIVSVATKIIELISRPCTNLDGNDIQVSPSIGIAVFPQDGHNVETLCQHADAAMYQSKRAGRGRYTFYDPALNPASDRQFSLEQRLPTAIAEDELVLHFQPKVRLSDFKIVGLEALVRWQHPEHGLIYPGEFVPMAELSGMDVALGDWVAQSACMQLAQWKEMGLEPVPVAINVSARQLRDLEFPQRVASMLASFGIATHLLEVEITESSLVESIEIATKVLTELQQIGVRIALDDFGNGYSSLSYIRTLPIHAIKIDRAFIKDIRNNPQDATIVETIVTMAHKLQMQVVAEGVELQDQLLHLKSINCDQVQGYYMSRPVDAGAAGQLIRQSILTPPK
ncbi:EAL domain-containing protein [Rhodoferax sp. GW822-FHT02A01]|uniref:putative bifunctional diguanylate cyclase/phosphodiesterase n=1 Tax=Rhodoferax sp. GW822-FHT02A01 TaxID=3141537 RepID=UPI00315DA496